MFKAKNIVCFLLTFCLGPSRLCCDRNKTHQFTQVTAGPMGEIGPRCSPDGHYLAFEYFSAEHPDVVQVWLMPAKGQFSDAKPLLGYTGNSYGEISWSPDSAWLSFIGGSSEPSGVFSEQIFKINVANKQITQLTKFPPQTSLGGTSWSRDGRILFEMDDDLYTVSQIGGAVSRIVDVRAKLPGVTPIFPSWSPDASRVLFVGRERSLSITGAGQGLYVVDLASGKIAKVLGGLGDDEPSWFDPERILCSRVNGASENSIWLVHVLGGTAIRLTEGFFDISPAACPGDGDVYFARNVSISRSKSLMDGFHIWRFKLRTGSSLVRDVPKMRFENGGSE